MNKIFSKDKDWVLLIGYIGLIYSTLQFMPKASAFLSSLLGRYFGLASNAALIIVILTVFILIFKRKPAIKNPVLFYAAMALIFASYLSLLLFALPIVAEKLHLLEYGFLSYLALRAVRGAQSPRKVMDQPCRHCEAAKRPKQSLYAYAVVIIILVGYCDELIQKFTPGRYYETRDVALNIVSAILGLFVLRLYEKPELY